MSRRLVARTARLNAGYHVAVFVDMEANVGVVTLAGNNVEIAAVDVPGVLLPAVIDGLMAVRIELNRKVRLRAPKLARSDW